MSAKDRDFHELLPIELKIRLLEAELERLESDLRWLEERRQQILEETRYYQQLLAKGRVHSRLKRVK
jgi:hypothetical protein